LGERQLASNTQKALTTHVHPTAGIEPESKWYGSDRNSILSAKIHPAKPFGIPTIMPEETEPQTADSQPQRQFALRSVYVKDISFESPNAPDIFRGEWKPETSLQLDIKVNPLAEDTQEIVLTVTISTKVGDKTAYLIEVQQAGMISASGFNDQERGPLLYVYCPSILFPYARQAVSDLVAKGGFPHLVLQHINFDQIFAQKLAEQRAGQAPSTEKPH
jgi:preprotein translocase subunit SecB